MNALFNFIYQFYLPIIQSKLRTVFVDLGVVCMLLVAVGVSAVSASYEDGYPDSASKYHGDGIFWVNSGYVCAFYCQPMLYCTEQHSAYCWSNWPIWVTDCTIEFIGKYYTQVMYHESWSSDGALSESEEYSQACKSARTYIQTRYINGITGEQWRDWMFVGVIAGTQPS